MPIQISRNQGDLDTIVAPWWGPDEKIMLKRVKSYVIDTRARTRASRIPEGLTWDQIQELSSADRSKLELFDSGAYNLSLFADMIVSWTLRFPDNEDGTPGEVIPCTPEYFEMLPDKDGSFIAEEISARGGGVAVKAAIGDATFSDPVVGVPTARSISDEGTPSDA